MGTPDAAEVIKSGVYRIDLGNEWYYVGSACNLKQRERQHRSDLRRGVHCNQIMQRAYDKYGQFSFMVLGRYAVDEILGQEQALLDEHCGNAKCANIALVVGSSLGVKRSDKARANMSAAASRRPPTTDEARANMSAARKGKRRPPFTPEWRSNIGAAGLGRKASDETRAKMSIAQTGRKMPPCSTEWRLAQSAAQTGKKASDATRAKMSASRTGKKRSPFTTEARAAMSAGQSARWARWRQTREAAATAL
jgi:group I intron endonuclease